MNRIRKVAVLGAGLMGRGIAAQIASAGFPVLLLDRADPSRDRNRLAREGLSLALTSHPSAFQSPDDARLITLGNFEDDRAALADCDWIVEAIREDLSLKRALFAWVDAVRHPNARVSTNTSGIPLAQLSEGRSASFREHFFVSHFFNPVRLTSLLELVLPRDDDLFRRFAEERLGKRCVRAKDSPGFIANRIGVFAMMDALHRMEELRLSPDRLDALFGPLIARPKSGVCRTADLVGLDTLLDVAENLHALLPDDPERERLLPPASLRQMVARGLLGEKVGRGFYQRQGKSLSVIDLQTFEYHPIDPESPPALQKLAALPHPADRLTALFAERDPLSLQVQESVTRTVQYARLHLDAIAPSSDDVDAALRWGFNWELGPFEIEKVLRAGKRSSPSPNRLGRSASITEIGDGLLGVTIHSKSNTIDEEVLSTIERAVDQAERGPWEGLLLMAQGESLFSGGANLALLLALVKEGDFVRIEQFSRRFQQVHQRLRWALVPSVAAPFGWTVGGGAELVLGTSLVLAHAELKMGLVEAKVGLVPAGGGTKEMTLRQGDPSRTFELLTRARVSDNSAAATTMGFLTLRDRSTLSLPHLVPFAREALLGLARSGYRRPAPRVFRAPGAPMIATLLASAPASSPYEKRLATQIATIVCGGAVPPGTEVTEEGLLDLEREAILSLCGEPETRSRIEARLKR